MNNITKARLLTQVDQLATAYNATQCPDARKRIKKARQATLTMLKPVPYWQWATVACIAVIVALSMQVHAWHYAATEYKAMYIEACLVATGGEEKACKSAIE